MYLPHEFAARDDSLAWSLIEEHPFGVLLSPSDGAFSHLLSALAARANTEDLKVLEWMRRVLG